MSTLDEYFWCFAVVAHIVCAACALVYMSYLMLEYCVRVLDVHKAFLVFIADRWRKHYAAREQKKGDLTAS